MIGLEDPIGSRRESRVWGAIRVRLTIRIARNHRNRCAQYPGTRLPCAMAIITGLGSRT
jgi:hypothetical protein